MTYLLDADVFLRAKNQHYGLDFCPAFWDWLIEKHEAGIVFSIEKVEGEIGIDDDLADWVAERGPAFFLPPTPAILPSLSAVSQWATGAGYDQAAVQTFLQVADYYLVSHAHAEGLTVVTHEVPAATPKKIKIPNACIALGVKFMTPFEMLRRERARFVLGGG